MTTATNASGSAAPSVTPLDPMTVRGDFPILARTVHGKPLVYLDNAATTHKPQAVIDAVVKQYTHRNSNVHRGVHTLSQESTDAFERARDCIARRINAPDASEVIFVRGTTEGINLVANAWGGANVEAGDEILLTHMEHHSNIVPWQLLAEATGARVKVVPVTDRGELDMEAFERLLSERTRIVAVVHVSNALGTINPVRDIARMAHRVGALVLADGAQGMQHLAVDVRDLDVDFYAFSGHKMYGPTGIGAVWGRRELLESMPPWMGGGDMIKSVSFEGTTYNDIPNRFEAGTPNVAGAIGLGAAVEYLNGLDMAAVIAHEDRLLAHAAERLAAIDGVRLVGTAARKASSVSFVMDGIHPHDIGTILDHEGIAIRTGHHCTQPLMERFGVAATARASFCFYNTLQEVDALADGLARVREVFA